jgi:hypothetical protein
VIAADDGRQVHSGVAEQLQGVLAASEQLLPLRLLELETPPLRRLGN